MSYGQWIAKNRTLISGQESYSETGIVNMTSSRNTSMPVISSVLLLIGTVLLPYGYQETVGLGSANHLIRWPFWVFIDSFYHTGFTGISVQEILEFTPFWIMRLILVYWVFRYYSGKVTRRQTLVVGIISEVLPLILTLPSYILSLMQASPFSSLILPIPTLLGLAVIFLYLIPYANHESAW